MSTMGAIWKATVTGTLRFLNLMNSVENQEVGQGLWLPPVPGGKGG